MFFEFSVVRGRRQWRAREKTSNVNFMFAAENEKFPICGGEKMKANRNNVKQQNVVVDSCWIRSA